MSHCHSVGALSQAWTTLSARSIGGRAYVFTHLNQRQWTSSIGFGADRFAFSGAFKRMGRDCSRP